MENLTEIEDENLKALKEDLKWAEDLKKWARKNEEKIKIELKEMIDDHKSVGGYTDLLLYQETEEHEEYFDTFWHTGNSWLDDDHITLYSFDSRFLEFDPDTTDEEMEYWLEEQVENAYLEILKDIDEEIEHRKYIVEDAEPMSNDEVAHSHKMNL